jgi:hypothetical protein
MIEGDFPSRRCRLVEAWADIEAAGAMMSLERAIMAF